MSRLSDEEKLSETAQLLQGVEPTEEYSLEDILAEFGQVRRSLPGTGAQTGAHSRTRTGARHPTGAGSR